MLTVLEPLRMHLNLPIGINNSYRCPQLPSPEIRGTTKSQRMPTHPKF